jgi:hypothetical protein
VSFLKNASNTIMESITRITLISWIILSRELNGKISHWTKLSLCKLSFIQMQGPTNIQ